MTPAFSHTFLLVTRSDPMRNASRRRPSLETLEDRRLLTGPGATDPSLTPVGPNSSSPPVPPADVQQNNSTYYFDTLTLNEPYSNPWTY
jgi:hypothetical protein